MLNDSSSLVGASASLLAHNVRRLMAREGMSYDEVVEASGLDARTIRAIIREEKQTRAQTLNKLAAGFGVSAEELFRAPKGITSTAFDVQSNPAIESVVESHPDLFVDWTNGDFAELASRFGVGGALTEAGVLAEAEAMNARRQVLRKARVVLESKQGDLLCELIESLYKLATIKS